jgi:RimJ/RimL family protein N-acetyltransferase
MNDFEVFKAINLDASVRKYLWDDKVMPDNELKLTNLVASMDKANIHSQRVCERLGFKFVEERQIDGKPVLFYKLSNTRANTTHH